LKIKTCIDFDKLTQTLEIFSKKKQKQKTGPPYGNVWIRLWCTMYSVFWDNKYSILLGVTLQCPPLKLPNNYTKSDFHPATKTQCVHVFCFAC